MAAKIFIDGEAGTTGLDIRKRLEARPDLELMTIEPERRKDPGARAERLNSAAVVVLCLPDDAAREAVALISEAKVRVIDASSAHRVAPGWTYGFPEMSAAQRKAIAASRRVSNPGCYATGFIGLVRPLVEAGLVPKTWPITANAVSGYSGGGKSMIAQFEEPDAPGFTDTPYRLYATGLTHKHIPEMQVHGRLAQRPLFAPAVGRFFQGMIVEIPLHLRALPVTPRIKEIHAALRAAYAAEPFVEVAPLEENAATPTIDAQALNHTNRMRLHVFGSEAFGQARLVAVLDNLGKGASGAAVQNLNLMLGLPEGQGL